MTLRTRLMFATPIAAFIGLGLMIPTAFAQSPGMGATGMGGPMGGQRMERMADRMKDSCARMEARLAKMDKKLKPDQVRDIVAGQLAQSGNANIKVGKVQAKAL